MQSLFDSTIDRTGSASIKWDGRKEIFGREDITPLWVADMDFAVPACVSQALERRLAHGVFGYTKVPASFAEAVAGWMARRHGWEVRPEWVVPASGVVYGVHVAVRALTPAGCGVVVQPPVYFPFYRAITSNERSIVASPLRLEHGRYSMDLADLEARLASGAKALILCSPHNPGGRVWSRDDLAGVLEVAARQDAIVVCDEIHADLVFPGARHFPIGGLPGGEERVVTLSGPTKTFNFPGLPIGYAIVANEDLRRRFREELRRTAAPGPSIFALDALQAAYRDGEGWLADLLAYLGDNRKQVEALLRERLPAAKPMTPEATYLSWIDFRGLGLSEESLAERLVQEARVGLNRGSTFGAEGTGFMRLNFACPRPLLLAALERIASALAPA